MRIEYLYIIMVALLWGGWPLVARSSGEGGAMASLLLSLVSLVPIGVMAWIEGGVFQSEGANLPRLVVAGAMMGGGLVAFNRVANSSMEASVSIPIMDAAMLVVSVVGAALFFAEPMTLRKLVGIALLISGIGLIRPG